MLEKTSKRWFLLRHGRSEANASGLIASTLASAGDAFGLTAEGRQEVDTSVKEAAKQLQGALLITSPLLRTRETADIAGRLLNLKPIIDSRLRERDFGDLDGLSDAHYAKVWEQDQTDPSDLSDQVETVYAVQERITELVRETEEKAEAETILLVTHCDVAMILTCAFRNLDPRHHRSLDPMMTGEIRALPNAATSG